MSDAPSGLDQFISVKDEPVEQVQPSANPAPAGLDEFVKSEKYTTPLQTALSAGEGGVKGILGKTLGSALLRSAGTPEEDILAREEYNPGVHGLSEAATMGVGLLAGTGEAGLINKAGEALQLGMGVAREAPLLNRLGIGAIRGAFENALLAGDSEAAKMFLHDPHQSAETAGIDIGLSAIIGGGIGGLLGASKIIFPESHGIVSELDKGAVEAGAFKQGVEYAEHISEKQKEGIFSSLGKVKKNAAEIKAALADIGAPQLEGILSDSKAIHMGEDALLNGAPSYSGLKRQKLYNEVYEKANQAVEESLGNSNKMTKAELGNVLKESLADPIQKQADVLGAGYEELKKFTGAVPVSAEEIPMIKKSLGELEGIRLDPGSAQANIAERVIKNIDRLKTVDDIKAFKSILNQDLQKSASPGERHVVSVISDHLEDLEEKSILNAAKSLKAGPEKDKILSLINQRKALDSQYKPFREDLNELLQKLGKKKVYGPKDALRFIEDDLTPEKVVDRLFSKKDSEFLDFFQKKFPKEMKMMADYQKESIKDAASIGGALNLKSAFKKIGSMEPEVVNKIFSPAELKKIQSAETVIQNFPKAFNPSGTSHMSAFREFFSHPTGATIANIRDFGIEKFIKMMGDYPELNVAGRLAQATINGEKAINTAVKSIFTPATAIPSKAIATEANIKSLKKLVDEFSQSQSVAEDHGIKENPIPEYNASFGSMTASALQYLSSVKPKTGKMSPLDSNRVPSKMENYEYDRTVGIAEKPLTALKYLKEGTLTVNDLKTLNTVYPNLYRRLREKVTSEIINSSSKNKIIPYKNRISMSLFVGQPLDTTMLPESIMAAQPKGQQAQPQMGFVQPQNRVKGSMKDINKLAMNYATPEQANEAKQVRR